MLKNIKIYNNFIKTALIKLLYIIIIPIIIYDIVLIFQSILKPDITPSILGIKTFTIISSSMEPTFNIDDVIFVKTYKNINKLQKGDVISFRQGGDIITHRIEKILKNGTEILFITKGDANNATDISSVKASQIEGIYIFKIPKAGKVLTILKNKAVFTFVIIVLIICYITEKNKILKKVERKEKREKYEKKNKQILK